MSESKMVPRYGCHCDIELMPSGWRPDACVFDENRVSDCTIAVQLQRDGQGRNDCKYWRPIKINEGGQGVDTKSDDDGSSPSVPVPPSPDARMGTHYEGCEQYHHDCALHAIDMAEASGMLMVDVPEPGTPMAKVMAANVALRRERDALRAENEALRGYIEEMRTAALVGDWHTFDAAINATVSGGGAAKVTLAPESAPGGTAQANEPISPDRPTLSYAHVRAKLDAAKTRDALDEAAAEIALVVSVKQQAELTELYKAAVAALEG